MSTSDTSGSSGGFVRRYFAGISVFTSATGTSVSGSENANRPGADSSKISLSYCGIAMSGHRPDERVSERVDLLPAPLLGHGHEQAVLQRAVERLERHAREDSVSQEFPDDALGRLRQFERELLEVGRAEAEPHTGHLGELARRVVSLRRGQFPHA